MKLNNLEMQKLIIKRSTINNLSDVVNELNLGESMDRILHRIDSNHSYYKNQINIFNYRNIFGNILKP